MTEELPLATEGSGAKRPVELIVREDIPADGFEMEVVRGVQEVRVHPSRAHVWLFVLFGVPAPAAAPVVPPLGALDK